MSNSVFLDAQSMRSSGVADSSVQRRRKFARRQCKAHCDVTIGDSFCLSGKILDSSAGGVFVGAVDFGYDQGRLYYGSDANEILGSIAIGDCVKIKKGNLPMVGYVRWIGYSQANQSYGFGVEFGFGD